MNRSLPIWLMLCGALLCGSPVSGQVVISEFMADNKKTLADEDGQYPDWIEIYNTNSATVNLTGWSLTDDPARLSLWFFPTTNLPPKGFMVIFASGKNRTVAGAPLHTGFSLKASGEYFALVRPDGSVAAEFAPTFPPQYPDISYGIAQDVSTNMLMAPGSPARVLIPASGALGTNWSQPSFDDAAWLSGPTAVGYEVAVPGFAVYNYVANVGVCSLAAALSVISDPAQQVAVIAENAPTINYLNTGDSSHYGTDRTFPGLTIGVDQDNYALEAKATLTIPAPGYWTFGVNSDDGFRLTIGSFNLSYPDPRGPGDTLSAFYFSAAGDYPLDLIFYECGGGSEVELFAAPGNLSAWNSTNFRLVGDAANGGLAVKAPVVSGGSGDTGYRSLIQTDLQAQMFGVNPTAYLRALFDVDSPAALRSLTLGMMYDDGFVAYLNGQEVARRNAPTLTAWNSTATAAHPNYAARVFEEINLSDRLNLLRPGNNLLAIQGLNQSAADVDFLIAPELLEYQVTNTSMKYFAQPTPGGINSSGFVAFVADTKFSVDRGFFTVPFTLSITSATTDATVIYTTDGSTPSLSNGQVCTGPISITGTTVIRAAAFKPGFQPSNIDTESYIFPDDVVRQSPNGETPPGWPSSWGANVVDYGMDPRVVNDPAYSGEIRGDLLSIPTYSIVTDSSNLFDAITGIYANAGQDGRAWERSASIELINPDGQKGFHINAGLRIRGGYSRSTGNPKHAFRFFFRQEYGIPKLQFPAFQSQDGADSFDGYDLRTFENYSWSFEGDPRFIGLRDQFSRDTQRAMGQPAERGDFYHLYINGQYWGLYNTDERAEASYGASYFGGNREDYDTIKIDPNAGYTIFATDGNIDAWARLWRAATNGFVQNADYFRIQGRNPDGTANPALENLLEVDDLIDEMLIIFFTGNLDAPISQFLSDQAPNNLFALRNRTGLYGGFRFFLHDSEHTLLDVNVDRTGPFAAGDPVQQGADGAFARSNPQYLFTRLIDNPEFRLRVADHVQRHFFNGGALTAQSCQARLLARSNEVYAAIACESARWGDSKVSPPRTRNVDWVAEMKRIYTQYFPQRPAIVLGQLRAKQLYPTLAAPSFNRLGGNVPIGFPLSLSASAGGIYYTLDGTDPRLVGGSISPSARLYTGAFALSQSSCIRARALSNGTWSALSEATFFVIQTFKDLLITEIMYHPPDTPTSDGDEFEFLELKNTAATTLELSGVHFASGIDFTFPLGTFVAPGQFLVLARNPAALTNKYPGLRIDGLYSGKLSNSGDTLTLCHVDGTPIVSVTYGTRPPWPTTADGAGFSLVPVNANFNPDPVNPANWRASSVIGGSPGADDPQPGIPGILVNEALTHTDPPQLDSVELYNPYPTNVDVGGWFLTDQRSMPQKFRIPTPWLIPAGCYTVFTELDWNADPNSTNGFRLDSHGEEIYLFSADPAGNLTGYSDGFAFGAAQNGVSFGRYITSTGEAQYPAQIRNTLGGPNAGPRVGPIVINEINYHPGPADDQFIELRSVTNSSVQLYDPDFPTNGWRLNGVGFDFTAGTEIPAQGLLLLVAGDPAGFRAKYAVPLTVPIFGPFAGVLQANGETLALQRPDHPDLNTNTGGVFVPYIDVDVVRYSPLTPWPTNADGHGSSLERIQATSFGNDPINWRASFGPPSPGQENLSNHPPVVAAGADQQLIAASSPMAAALAGAATDDGAPVPPALLRTTWNQVSGPGSVWFSDPHRTNSTAYLPGVGTYVLRLTADDGALRTSDDVTLQVSRATTPITLVSTGSVWKYLDDGSQQGIAWRGLGFNDALWAYGPAPLGYGDANGQWPATTNNYGPDPNNKYITTYYRHAFAVSNATSIGNLLVQVQRDDGVIVYLNGQPIFTNNMPAGPITYQTLAASVVGGADEATFYSQTVDPSLLLEGANVVAAEIHQANASSSDIVFDLQLAANGYPPNQPPQVEAGPDQVITLPAGAALNGQVSDDGLPIPPGVLSVAWTNVSGPAQALIADPANPQTTAVFPTSGTYLLRLTANDGASSASSDLTVTVLGQSQPLRIDSATLATDGVHLKFVAGAGLAFSIQYRDSLTEGSWRWLLDVPAQPNTTLIDAVDSTVSSSPTRYYRIVSPQVPSL